MELLLSADEGADEPVATKAAHTIKVILIERLLALSTIAPLLRRVSSATVLSYASLSKTLGSVSRFPSEYKWLTIGYQRRSNLRLRLVSKTLPLGRNEPRTGGRVKQPVASALLGIDSYRGKTFHKGHGRL